jgi:rSAM/selenodomain-associated transferase 2
MRGCEAEGGTVRQPAASTAVQSLTVVVPVLNEARLVADCLGHLQELRRNGTEVIVVDGGSTDATAALAQPLADHVIRSPRGRAVQMNSGAAAASGDILLFLHADSIPPDEAARLVAGALSDSSAGWGRFDVEISGAHPMLGVIGWFMNLRSRLTGICTGDQAIFVRRAWFEAAGGYPDIALMEDIALSRKLRARGWPRRVGAKLRTSGRRWENNGVWRTILLMWWLRMSFFFGANPQRLARRYERH